MPAVTASDYSLTLQQYVGLPLPQADASDRRRRIMAPLRPKPTTIIVQLCGSGTELAAKEPDTLARVVLKVRAPVTLVSAGLTDAIDNPGTAPDIANEKS